MTLPLGISQNVREIHQFRKKIHLRMYISRETVIYHLERESLTLCDCIKEALQVTYVVAIRPIGKIWNGNAFLDEYGWTEEVSSYSPFI